MKRDMILKPWQIAHALETLLLGNPGVKAVKDARGNVIFVEEARDSGSEWMTIDDMAALLQKPVTAIREMCKARAQAGPHPLPFSRFNGKGVRFERAKVTEWLQTTPERPSRPRRKPQRHSGDIGGSNYP